MDGWVKQAQDFDLGNCCSCPVESLTVSNAGYCPVGHFPVPFETFR